MERAELVHPPVLVRYIISMSIVPLLLPAPPVDMTMCKPGVVRSLATAVPVLHTILPAYRALCYIVTHSSKVLLLMLDKENRALCHALEEIANSNPVRM